MNYYIYGYTDTGDFRNHNEDSILIDHEVLDRGGYEASVMAPFITAVCDGVGGENAGELAAKLCLQHLSILDYTSNCDLWKTLIGIHNKIKKNGVTSENAANMQTTLCGLAVDENGKAICVNVGDSRMYRYVNGTIRQISNDQSYGQFLYEHGQIESMDELQPEYQNAIISSIGSTVNDPDIVQTPLVNEFGVEADDMIIIVSDGISDYVSESEFEVGLAMDLPVIDKLEALAKLAIMNGSTDNVSIIGIKPYVDEDELIALTVAESFEQTVNIEEILAETDNLSDILTIDIDQIIHSQTKSDEIKSEEIALETHDLNMQAMQSLSKLSSMFGNDEE